MEKIIETAEELVFRTYMASDSINQWRDIVARNIVERDTLTRYLEQQKAVMWAYSVLPIMISIQREIKIILLSFESSYYGIEYDQDVIDEIKADLEKLNRQIQYAEYYISQVP